jgi:amino acid transporter
LGIPYEIVALNVLLTYWTDKVPVAVVVVVAIILYAYAAIFRKKPWASFNEH